MPEKKPLPAEVRVGEQELCASNRCPAHAGLTAGVSQPQLEPEALKMIVNAPLSFPLLV